MKILTVDIGTGTQDIYLFNERLNIENGFKLIVPSPTMRIHAEIKQATRRQEAIALTGYIMGGGPSAWAAEAHLKAGLPVYATPDAARTFNDDLAAVAQLGVTLVSEEEVQALPPDVRRLELRDFDFPAIARALAEFGVDLDDLAAVAVAVFDHGDSPPEISDRQFRFDYLDERIRRYNRLSAFAHRSDDVPAIMTRLQAVARSASGFDAPLVVMDTAPAAVLGAQFDRQVAAQPHKLIANVGNFHTLAFRLGPGGIEGVFEHHTGLLNRPELEELLRRLADGSLKHEEVFGHHGHGALVYDPAPLAQDRQPFFLAVTGPRRSLMVGSDLNPYFAVPFGDMMIAGCFGLLAATAEVLPDLAGPIRAAFERSGEQEIAPWDA